MSKNSLEKILAKLVTLKQYLGYLKELGKYQTETFVSDYRIHGLAERYLQLSIEVVLDIGRLVIIEAELPKPENNHEIFEILYKRKIISKALFEKLYGVAGFRNILVHAYEKIDLKIVHKNLKRSLTDFPVFAAAIHRSLKKRGKI